MNILHISRTEYTDDSLPRHSCLILIANSEQPLAANTARRLLTYEKISENYEEHQDIEIDATEDFRTK